jgi:hypothetical protein
MERTQARPGTLDAVTTLAERDATPAADEVFRPWAETLPAAEPLDTFAPGRGRAIAAAGVGLFSLLFYALRNAFRR